MEGVEEEEEGEEKGKEAPATRTAACYTFHPHHQPFLPPALPLGPFLLSPLASVARKNQREGRRKGCNCCCCCCCQDHNDCDGWCSGCRERDASSSLPRPPSLPPSNGAGKGRQSNPHHPLLLSLPPSLPLPLKRTRREDEDKGEGAGEEWGSCYCPDARSSLLLLLLPPLPLLLLRLLLLGWWEMKTSAGPC